MNKKILWFLVILIIIGGVIFWFFQSSLLAPEEQPEEEGISSVGQPVFPKMSPINSAGEVVTKLGKSLNQSATPGSANTPQPSRLLRIVEIPQEGVTTLQVLDNSFNPDSLEFKPEKAVTLCVDASENPISEFGFRNSSLRAIVLNPEDQAQCISFNTPGDDGDFVFYAQSKEQGEITGLMTIK